MKILLIDDDAISRKMLAQALEQAGYFVIQGRNGRHGWETLFENDDIELVITDMVMPDIDGRELVELIRQRHVNPALPVIIFSGLVNQDEVQDLLDMGNCCFIAKPLNVGQIKAAVLDLMQETQSRSR